MGRRVRTITDSIRRLIDRRPDGELRFGVRLIPARCTWCEDWMVVCEGEPDLAPLELRPGLCQSCRESVAGTDRVAAAGGS